MFQPSTTNILPIVNPSITQDFKSTGYNWQKWAKWGLLSAGGLAATAAVIYGGPMIFTGLFSLMTGVAAKLSGDGQGNALAPFEPSNMLMANPVDLALPSPQGGLNKDDWLTEFVGSTSEELPEYLKDTIKEQSADLDEAELAEDTEDYLDGLSNLFNKPFLDEEKTSDDLERDHVLAEPPSAKTDTDITELLLPAVIEKQQATSLKLTEFEELSIDPISKQQSKRSPALFPEVIELSSLTGSTGFKLDGEAADDWSGYSVASAGDINGDNITDLIVGAPDADSIMNAGQSYVVFGHTGAWASPIELSSLTGVTGFKLDGEAVGDYSGYSVASAGDINGDSIDDLIVGAFYAGPSGRGDAGRSYVVFGHTGAWASPIELSSLTGTTGFKLDGEAASDYSGVSVSSAGDINGDSITDLIVGAYYANPSGRIHAGRSYVVFGHTGAWASPIELSSLTGATGFKLDGEAAYDWSGYSVASAGDINGDSITDLIVGAYGADPSLRSTAGRSYVVFGHTGAWTSPIELSSLTGTNGFKLDGEAAGDRSGVSVASAGDINGDSITDLIVGAYYAGPSGRGYAGRSYVVFGRSAQSSSSSTISAPFSSSPPVSSDSTLVSSITSPSSLHLSSTSPESPSMSATIDLSSSSSSPVSSDSTLVSSITSPSSTTSASSITNPSSLHLPSTSPELSTLPVLSSSNQQQLYSSSNEPVQPRGSMLWLIGLVIGLGAVAGGGVIAGFLVRRYLHNRDQEFADIELQSEKLPFRIIRQIGRGGNAEVYEGEWIKAGSWQGKHVAIKKLPDIFKELSEATNEFTKEARFLQQYRHPNLIEFVDFFSVPHWCLVLKYYYRGSLDKVLTDEHYLLPWNPERNGFMCGIANGLKFLHENGIIHRDMKPGNVLIDEDMTPKITDFGTVRIQATATMTKGVGTPAYVAPEIITAEDGGKIRYTNSVDVYSYGLILWAIWQRKEPFTQFEQSWQIIKYAVDKQGRPSLESCPSPSLANLIGRCWAHRAKVRPSMQEVCEELNIVTAELAGA